MVAVQQVLAAACLFLAAKAEDVPVHAIQVCQKCWRSKYKNQPALQAREGDKVGAVPGTALLDSHHSVCSQSNHAPAVSSMVSFHLGRQ